MPINIGIALRYKDDLLDRTTTTVDEHNKIIHKSGKVWLGKFGVPIGTGILKALSEPTVQATLILLRSNQPKSVNRPKYHSAPISEARNARPKSTLIPAYYRKEPQVNTWFCLAQDIQPLTDAEVKSWVIISSGQTLLATIRYAVRPFFLITKKADLGKCRQFLERVEIQARSSRESSPPLRRPKWDHIPSANEDETDTADSSNLG